MWPIVGRTVFVRAEVRVFFLKVGVVDSIEEASCDNDGSKYGNNRFCCAHITDFPFMSDFLWSITEKKKVMEKNSFF